MAKFHIHRAFLKKRYIGFLLFCSFMSFLILGTIFQVPRVGYESLYYNFPQSRKELILEESDIDFNYANEANKYYKDPRIQTSERTSLSKPQQIIDALDVYPNLEFEANWTNALHYLWDEKLEKRFRSYEKSIDRVPLKIIVVPHSHNDPGWGWTMEEYYNMRTKNVFREGLLYLKEHKDMRFLWSEASFLHLWWGKANAEEQELFKSFVASGQLEIVTGGWVMTDEAVVHLYSMIDQLIEGHQWVKYNLNVSPKNGWSVDPFGYGPTLPYLLKNSGIDSAVILRTHYAWKKWFAQTQNGDFHWAPRFDLSGDNSIVCHQAPYFMYLMGASLGPHTKKSTKFDFSQKGVLPLKDSELEEMALLFLEEGGRTGSLFPHNVVLAILGEDFAYQTKYYWETNYENYKKLFTYINNNIQRFNVEVEFGTVATYFEAIKERNVKPLKTFIGDFFTYSDVVDPDKRAAYWSGYFATRPFWKKLYREAENSLRSAEILFSFSYSSGRFDNETESKKLYKALCVSRKLHGLFAHHDGSPGVSDRRVMEDYGNKLLRVIELSTLVQKSSTAKLLDLNPEDLVNYTQFFTRMNPNIYSINPIEFTQETQAEEKEIVIFNPLGWEMNKIIKLVVSSKDITIYGPNKSLINFQINPVYQLDKHGGIVISKAEFELIFIAKLQPLALSAFTIQMSFNKNVQNAVDSNKAQIFFTNNYNEVINGFFKVQSLNELGEELKLENDKLKITFDKVSGFLNQIIVQSQKNPEKKIRVRANITFGGYESVDHHSGPYLFRPKTNQSVKFPLTNKPQSILMTTGPVISTIVIKYEGIEHQVEIVHFEQKLKEAIFIKNTVDTKHQNGEFYMRIDSDLNSETKIKQKEETLLTPTFFTDQNGFTFEKRVKISEIGIEGNYYPITSLAFLEDARENLRLSLLVDRAHGASSFKKGRLEVMIERRVPFDDNRGIGQGVTDNRETISNYVLSIEQLMIENESKVASPTLQVHHLAQQLNYPPSIFIMSSREKIQFEDSSNKVTALLNKGLEEDAHLLTFRTLNTEEGYDEMPSKSVLTLIHKLGYKCKFEEVCEETTKDGIFNLDTVFNSMMNLESVVPTELTGLKRGENLVGVVESLDQLKTKKYEIKSFFSIFAN